VRTIWVDGEAEVPNAVAKALDGQSVTLWLEADFHDDQAGSMKHVRIELETEIEAEQA
jgi:hypothetical protein